MHVEGVHPASAASAPRRSRLKGWEEVADYALQWALNPTPTVEEG